jgi:hypothetical protein
MLASSRNLRFRDNGAWPERDFRIMPLGAQPQRQTANTTKLAPVKSYPPLGRTLQPNTMPATGRGSQTLYHARDQTLVRALIFRFLVAEDGFEPPTHGL